MRDRFHQQIFIIKNQKPTCAIFKLSKRNILVTPVCFTYQSIRMKLKMNLKIKFVISKCMSLWKKNGKIKVLTFVSSMLDVSLDQRLGKVVVLEFLAVVIPVVLSMEKSERKFRLAYAQHSYPMEFGQRCNFQLLIASVLLVVVKLNWFWVDYKALLLMNDTNNELKHIKKASIR